MEAEQCQIMLSSLKHFEADPHAVNAFSNNWSTRKNSLLPGSSLSLSYGDELLIAGKTLGIIASLSHKYSNNYKSGNKNLFNSRVGNSNQITSKYKSQSSISEANLTAMLNLAYKISNNQSISLKNIYTKKAERKTENYFGYYHNSNGSLSDPFGTGAYDQTILAFTEENILSNKFDYEAYFESLKKMKLNVEASYINASRNVPDLRNIHYTKDNQDRFEVALDQQSNRRYYSRQDDINLDFTVSSKIKLNRDLDLSTGFHTMTKNRDFSSNNFFFKNINNSLPNDLKYLRPETVIYRRKCFKRTWLCKSK